MLDQILSPDIDDKRQFRLQRGDVRKVLFGTHAEINASCLSPCSQVREDALKRAFVGHKVVGDEGAARLGEVAYYLPECFIAELRGKLFGPREAEENEYS